MPEETAVAITGAIALALGGYSLGVTVTARKWQELCRRWEGICRDQAGTIRDLLDGPDA